uniref:KOW domain-containing protein n=1 Tax=candidate division WOR-3 bacterium TaxID=2052148 RepID=A0A7C4GGI4_UNCW3
MAHAYTPGLKVTRRTLVRKVRRLPLPGETLVEKGQRVQGEDIVARTQLPGNVQTVNVGGLLGVPPEDVPQLMMKAVGDAVAKDEVIARSKGLFGLFKSEVRSPAAGKIENVSPVTGQVIVREPPQPVQVDAYIEGEVAEVIPREGVVVANEASLVQGIFGVGGEVRGRLRMVARSPDQTLAARDIKDDHKDQILVAGALVTAEAIERALAVKAKALVGGGIEDSTLRQFLGYDIGVAITGSERRGLTIIVTEGFGEMRMAARTFELLQSLEGRMASANGATQIRAGVIRPEIVVPTDETGIEIRRSEAEGGLAVGMPVRVIRQPHFGRIGRVTGLPVDLALIETEAKVRVLEVEFEDGQRVVLPRANVEIIES